MNLFGGLFGGTPTPPRSLPSREDSEKQAAALGVQQPAYATVSSGAGWEIRRIQAMQVVECEYEKRPEGYELLGGYAQRGENAEGLAMPATAPCLMRPLARPKTMWYMLPAPHTPMDPDGTPVDAPAPVLGDLLRIKSLPPMLVGVATFSGYAVPDVVFAVRDQLAKALVEGGATLADDALEDGMLLAQFNELFALPWARENEVWVPLKMETALPPPTPPPPPPPPPARCAARASPPVMMGWLDQLTDAMLGESAGPGLADGCADAYAEADTAVAEADEAAAAAGFDGAALAALVKARWGAQYDLEFTRTDYLGKASLYLNVFPWTADAEPWRHESESAYLEHCQAIAELLLKWGQVAGVKRQMAETDKAPRRGTIPIKTVPLRLDLPNELVKSFRE